MAPVFFPVFLPAQGGPAVLGLGSLLTGGLLPGLDPLGVLQLQGLLGFGADGRYFIVTKMFFKINDFYHSFSGSFPSF